MLRISILMMLNINAILSRDITVSYLTIFTLDTYLAQQCFLRESKDRSKLFILHRDVI